MKIQKLFWIPTYFLDFNYVKQLNRRKTLKLRKEDNIYKMDFILYMKINNTLVSNFRLSCLNNSNNNSKQS